MRAHLAVRRGARGVTMLMALIVMVILGIAAVAIAKSVYGGTYGVGSIATRNEIKLASARGTEAAVAWLKVNLSGTALENDLVDEGYYATTVNDLDPTGLRTSAASKLKIVKWNGKCDAAAGSYVDCLKAFESGPINGNKVQWVITRLCVGTGPPAGTVCARPSGSIDATVADRGEIVPGGRLKVATSTPYFRIVVRVDGPRNAVSYTEQIVHF